MRRSGSQRSPLSEDVRSAQARRPQPAAAGDRIPRSARRRGRGSAPLRGLPCTTRQAGRCRNSSGCREATEGRPRGEAGPEELRAVAGVVEPGRVPHGSSPVRFDQVGNPPTCAATAAECWSRASSPRSKPVAVSVAVRTVHSATTAACGRSSSERGPELLPESLVDGSEGSSPQDDGFVIVGVPRACSPQVWLR